MTAQERAIHIAPNARLLDLQPPIPGYGRFISSYLISAGKKAIVDPGPAVAMQGLLRALAEAGVKPEEIEYVFLTHIHIDHAGGVGGFIQEAPNARVIAHEKAIPHLVDPQRLWNASLRTLGDLAAKYGRIEPVPAERIMAAADGMKIDLDGTELEVYLTPGHAVHHISLFDRSGRLLIAGEAAGVCTAGKIRPATPPPFKLEETLASVDKLIALRPARLCYGHFGCYADGLARLKLYRQKLLDWNSIVTREAAAGRNSEQTLTVLRNEDGDLAYLDDLDENEYRRELVLLLNSIRGMSGKSD